MAKPKIKEPFVKDSMKLPKNIVYTGDINALSEYLENSPVDANGAPLSEAARQHIHDRIENMKYINDRAKDFSHKKIEPLPAVQTNSGYVLQGIHQPERQQTGHCCWTMPAKLMLQSRGIDLDQESIRCYKPELRLNEEQLRSLDEETIGEFTKNTNGNIKNLSGLMSKFLPNTAMVQINYYVPYNLKVNPEAKAENELFKQNFKQQITSAIRDHKTPVALLRNGHYRTIVGIEGDDLIIKDSLSAIHGPDSNHKISIDSFFKTPNDKTEITFMRDLTVQAPNKLPSELAPFEKALKTENGFTITAAPETANGITNPDGSTIGLYGEVQHGDKVNLLYAAKIGDRPDGSSITVSEQWILPESLTDNVITTQRYEEVEIEQDNELTEEEIAANGGEKAGIRTSEELITNNKLADLTAREDEFLQELPESGLKRAVEMANEAREELRQLAAKNSLLWTTEDMKTSARCMHTMTLAKLIEAENTVNNGKPGVLEKRFDNGNGIDDILNDASMRDTFWKCPPPSEMTNRDITDFILNDTAGTIAREALGKLADSNRRLSEKERTAIKAKAAEGTDPSHELKRLKKVYNDLKNADPALMKSSAEFKAMKKSLENVISLRLNRCDIRDASINTEKRLKASSDLCRAYAELNQNARAYMNTKNPALLKNGTTAMRRFETATAIFDLSQENKLDYAKATSAISVFEQPVSSFAKEAISLSSDEPQAF